MKRILIPVIAIGLLACAPAARAAEPNFLEQLDSTFAGLGMTPVDTISTGQTSKTGYMIATEYREVTVDLGTMTQTEKKVEMSSTKIGRFDFSKDTVARFNVNFEDHRVMDAPAFFKNFRVSCYSTRQDEKRVKVSVIVEKFTDTWKPAAAASTVVDIGTPVIELRATPCGEDFQQARGSIKYYELGVRLAMGEEAPAPGKKTVKFSIPVRGRESADPR